MNQIITYCNDILAVMKQGCALHVRIRNGEQNLRFQLWQLEHSERSLRLRAAADFAKLNGWKFSEAAFAPTQLARASTQRKSREAWDEGWVHELFDHPVYFRETHSPYRPVAMVGQPYNTSVSQARTVALRLGLELHAPANTTASWWFPGATGFFCCTRPGHTVQFLPDQCSAPGADQ